MSDQPRTGTGDKPRGRKPKNSELRMRSADGSPRRQQPKGWVAKVIDIVTHKEK